MRFSSREEFWHRWLAYGPAIAVLLIGFAITGITATWFFREAKEIDAERFDGAVERLLNDLDERSKRYTMELEGFTKEVARIAEVSAEAWKIAHDRLGPKGKLPAVVELALTRNAGLKSLDEVKAVAHHAGTNRLGHFILPRIRWGTQEVIRHWTFNCSLTAGQTAAWLAEPDVKQNWTGIMNGKLSSSPKRVLQDENGNDFAAISFFFPIFDPDVYDVATEFPQIKHTDFMDYRFRGMALATLNWKTFLRTALSGDMARVGFEAFADTNMTAATWMGQIGDAPSRVLDPNFKPRFLKTIERTFFRIHWRMAFYSTPLFESLSPGYRTWLAVGGGSLFSVLTAGFVAVQIRARRRQERVSAKLARALDDLNDARNERARLNHDLHDGTIQSLYALQLGLSRSVEMAAHLSASLGTRMDDHRRTVSGVIGELRGFILRHEAESGPAGDLAGVLEALIQRLRLSTDKVLKTELSRDAARSLDGEQAVHLANLAREALSNVLRHAGASTIIVRLAAHDAAVTLEVTDDGVGFDLAAPPGKGLGLTSMSARAQQAGGTLQIDSKPEAGTRIRVIVPQTKKKECEHE